MVLTSTGGDFYKVEWSSGKSISVVIERAWVMYHSKVKFAELQVPTFQVLRVSLAGFGGDIRDYENSRDVFLIIVMMMFTFSQSRLCNSYH